MRGHHGEMLKSRQRAALNTKQRETERERALEERYMGGIRPGSVAFGT